MPDECVEFGAVRPGTLSWSCSDSVRVSGRRRIHPATARREGGRAVTRRGEVRACRAGRHARAGSCPCSRAARFPPTVSTRWCTLTPPVVEVRLEVAQDGGPVLPLTGEQLLRRLGVGQLLDGAIGHPELPLDRAPTVSCLQQGVNGGVPGPSPVGEPVSSRPWRSGRLRGRHGLGFGLSCRGRQDAQALAVLSNAPLGGFTQVVPEMPPVRDLRRLWCSGRGALGEERRVVSADDFDAGPLSEPSGLIDANHTRCRHLRLGKRVDQAQDRAPADGNAESGGEASTSPARQSETDRGQHRAQPLGALAVPAGQAGYLLHEGPVRTRGVAASEPANS